MGKIKQKTKSFIRICSEERKNSKSMERRNEKEKIIIKKVMISGTDYKASVKDYI